MEIDVTPEANSEKSDGASSQGEEENAEKEASERGTEPKTKKTIKHALRQQVKRRRKNTTIAAGTASGAVPRIIVKPLPPQPTEEAPIPPYKTPTMREVLASIPGFTMKPRRRTNKKLSTAAQLEQTKEGCIDLETPDSILVNTNLRLLLNKATFASLPLLYQNKLVQLLPDVDRHSVTNSADSLELSNSGLNNEFFARACLEWQDRLAEGEFTPENQQKLKLEADKERSRLDPWKLKHFEPIWGDRTTQNDSIQNSSTLATASSRPPIKTTIKLRPTTAVSTNKSKPQPPIKRLRTVGAMTRSCTSLKESEVIVPVLPEPVKIPIPDLLPITKPLRKEEPKATIDKPEAEKQENCIINISKIILQADEETIITCNNNKKAEKRRRSLSQESTEQSPKRKSKSPSPEKCPLPEPSPIPIASPESVTPEPPTSVEVESEQEPESELPIGPINEDLTDSVEPIKSDFIESSTDSNTTSFKDEEFKMDDDSSSTATVETEELKIEEETLKIEEDEEEEEETLPPPTAEPFPMLPNTLILQQESIVLEKTSCSEICGAEICMENSAEKLEEIVEESDLVRAQLLTESNFESVRNIADDDANEDRFIDAENYVLESGQITVEGDETKEKERTTVDIQATLFGADGTQGNMLFYYIR